MSPIAPTNVPCKNHICCHLPVYQRTTALEARYISRRYVSIRYVSDRCHSPYGKLLRIVEAIGSDGAFVRVSEPGVIECDLDHIFCEKVHTKVLIGQVLPHE